MSRQRRLTTSSAPFAIAGVCAALLALGSLPARAAIIDVPAERATLQAAVANAASGDTILFAPGTYVGGVWIQDKSLVFASWYLTTGDTSYIAQTILSGLVTTGICGGDNGCTGDASLEFGSHTDGSAVIGLSLTGAVKGVRTSARLDFDHCKAYGMTGAGDGVNYLPRSSGTISNSLFMNNRDDGIDLNGEVNVNVINNVIRDNWDDGIEFRMYPWAGEQKTVLITGNLFISNDSDAIQLIDSPDSSHRDSSHPSSVSRANSGYKVPEESLASFISS